MSRNSASRLAATAPEKKPTQVRLPPGRFKPLTSPSAIGSPLVVKTVGMVVVARLAASAAALSLATITATFWRTRSAASAGIRSYCPSPQRSSIVASRPSTRPVWARPCRNSSKRLFHNSAVSLPRNPTTGIAACCARAANGHAAALASEPVMNSRRFMCSNPVPGEGLEIGVASCRAPQHKRRHRNDAARHLGRGAGPGAAIDPARKLMMPSKPAHLRHGRARSTGMRPKLWALFGLSTGMT